MTTTPSAADARRRVRLDRSVLVSNLVAGGVCLLVLGVPFVGWWLSVAASAYVVAGSVFLAAAYARHPLTPRQELLTWTVPWAVAVALWFCLGLAIDGGDVDSGWTVVAFFAVLVATPLYVLWQVVALGLRRLPLKA